MKTYFKVNPIHKFNNLILSFYVFFHVQVLKKPLRQHYFAKAEILKNINNSESSIIQNFDLSFSQSNEDIHTKLGPLI